MTRQDLIERILDVLTPEIEYVASNVLNKVKKVTPKDDIPIAAVQGLDRIKGGARVAVYGKEHGLSRPVSVRLTKGIGTTALAGTGNSIGGATRFTKNKKGAEIHLSRHHLDAMRGISNQIQGVDNSGYDTVGDSNKSDVSHELIHSQDKYVQYHGARQEREMQKYKNSTKYDPGLVLGTSYYSNPSEVMAYGATHGHYGATEMKKRGYTRQKAMAAMAERTSRLIHDTSRPLTTLQAVGMLPTSKEYSALGDKKTISKLPSEMRRKSKRAHDQYFKTLYAGADRAFAQEAKVLKHGGLTLAPNKPKLPEEVRQDLINHLIENEVYYTSNRIKERAVANNPEGQKAYWKERRKLGRRRVGSSAWEGMKKGLGLGAGVSMAASGVMIGANPFGESPKAWAVRQAQQHAGDFVQKAAWRIPTGLKSWHVAAAPTAIGAVGGGLIGAISGYRKGKNSWHSSREHTAAVKAAYDRVRQQQHLAAAQAKNYDEIIPRPKR